MNTIAGAAYQIKPADFAPLLDTVMANGPILVAGGIGLTVAVAGFRMIPKLFKSLVKS